MIESVKYIHVSVSVIFTNKREERREKRREEREKRERKRYFLRSRVISFSERSRRYSSECSTRIEISYRTKDKEYFIRFYHVSVRPSKRSLI